MNRDAATRLRSAIATVATRSARASAVLAHRAAIVQAADQATGRLRKAVTDVTLDGIVLGRGLPMAPEQTADLVALASRNRLPEITSSARLDCAAHRDLAKVG